MKKISKLFAFSLVALGVVLGTSPALAQTYNTNANMNAQLQAQTGVTVNNVSTNAAGDVIVDFSVNLSQGTRGEFVKVLQAFLAAEEDVYAEGTVDGSFGPRTRQAVVNFQAKHGLKADGIVGPITRAKIKELIPGRPLKRVVDAAGNVILCAHVPPGHLIAPGYLRKVGSLRPVVPTCQDLPPGIEAKIDGSGSVDVTAPVISLVTADSVSSASATIKWTTNERATSQVSYGTTASYGSETSVSAGLATSHQVVLSGLSANTTYHFQVKSKDASGNLAVSADYALTTTDLDTLKPVISQISVSGITRTGAEINWTTNENTDAKVEYGKTTSYGTVTTDTSLSTSHSISLSGLSANTTYHYRITSKDDVGNTTVTADATFKTSANSSSNGNDTTAPTISGISVSGVTQTGATINWNTSENADAKVEYGTTTSYGSVKTDSSLTASHSLSLTGLSANTTYHYKITSKDSAGNKVVSADATFTTSASADVTAPTISGITVSATGTTVATVSWATNEVASGKVYYSTGASVDPATATVRSSSELSLSHSFSLTGLSAGTTYYFKVESTDGSSNTATSSVQSFATLGL